MTTETPQAAVPDKPKFGKPQIIATILTLLILIMVFVVVLPQFGDYGEAWAAIQGMDELNIGHSIVARAVMVGMERAVREMKNLLTSKVSET